jgi:hypothetical protein
MTGEWRYVAALFGAVAGIVAGALDSGWLR